MYWSSELIIIANKLTSYFLVKLVVGGLDN